MLLVAAKEFLVVDQVLVGAAKEFLVVDQVLLVAAGGNCKDAFL